MQTTTTTQSTISEDEQLANLTLTEIINSGNLELLLRKKEKNELVMLKSGKYLTHAVNARQPAIFSWLYEEALKEYHSKQFEYPHPDTELLSCLRLAVLTNDFDTFACVLNHINKTGVTHVNETSEKLKLDSRTDIFQICARNGNLDMLQHFYKKGYGLFDIIDRKTKKLSDRKANIFMISAGCGHLNIVKWMLTSPGLASLCEFEIDYDLIARLEQYEVLHWLFTDHLKTNPRRDQIQKDLLQSLKSTEPREFLTIVVRPLTSLEYANIFRLIRSCNT